MKELKKRRISSSNSSSSSSQASQEGSATGNSNSNSIPGNMGQRERSQSLSGEGLEVNRLLIMK